MRDTTLNLIGSFAKKADRTAWIVSNTGYDASGNYARKSQWLTVSDMFESETATLSYKAITGLTLTVFPFFSRKVLIDKLPKRSH